MPDPQHIRNHLSVRNVDSAISVYYYRARYYDPSVGRFLSEDDLRWSSKSKNFYGYANGRSVSFTDPTGHDIAVVGDLNDITSYVLARNYLLGDPAMAAIIHKLERSKKIYYIRMLRGGDCDDRTEGLTIYWNPTCGHWCFSGGSQSPALGLGHEMDHAANGGFWWPTLDDYDTSEERRVIEGSENSAARNLGEGVRHDHRGIDAPNLPGPISRPPP